MDEAAHPEHARLPSGRGATEQPNITSGGSGVLTPRFWVMVVLTGIAAGVRRRQPARRGSG
jgi:hypothetical protein